MDNPLPAAQGQIVNAPQGQDGGEEAVNAGIPVEMEAEDWRNQFSYDDRMRVVVGIMRQFVENIPFNGHEDLQELRSISIRLEEESFMTATSQPDYVKKMSTKMVTVVSQKTLQSNGTNPGENPSGQGVQAQVRNNSESGIAKFKYI